MKRMNEDVYLVREPTYHEPKIIAIFSKRYKAEEFKEAWDSYRASRSGLECQIEPYPTNVPKEEWGKLIRYERERK